MEVKFCTNSISLGKNKTFQDIIQEKLSELNGTVKTASTQTETTKEAKKTEKCKSSGQPQAEAKLVNDPKKSKKQDDKKKKDKKEASSEVDATKKATVIASTEEVVEDNSKEDDNKEETTEKEGQASEAPKFVKLSKLDDKTKTMLAAYYKTYWPAEFVDALLASK
jgi:hypothetical protein